MNEPAVAILELAGTERCADQGVEPEHEPHGEDATPMKRELPTPTAPIASGPSPPTISVSTIPIVIHPSSARTTGRRQRSIGRNS